MMPANSTSEADSRQASEAGRISDAITEVLDVRDVAEISNAAARRLNGWHAGENCQHLNLGSTGIYEKMILSASSPAG